MEWCVMVCKSLILSVLLGLLATSANAYVTPSTSCSADGLHANVYNKSTNAWSCVAIASSSTITATGSAPLALDVVSNVVTGSIAKASSTEDGYLSSTDWVTFNSKLSENDNTCDGGVLLATATASGSSTISFTGYMTSAYKAYVVKFYNLLPSTNSVELHIRVGAGGSYYSTDYTFQFYGQPIVTGNTYFPLDDNISSTANLGGISGTAKIFDPSNTIAPKTIFTETLGADASFGGATEYYTASGRYVGATTAITDVQLFFSSGNIASGTAYLCGKKY